jgi:organic hydroperoxide reductase OsmC/OhrA
MSFAPFPHVYRVRVEGGQMIAPPRDPVAVGAPPQFGGSDRVFGPEELLAGATALCLTTTFEALARHQKLEVEAFRCDATALLDRGTAGPVFTGIQLDAELTVPAGAVALASRLLADAKRRCIVANALRCPVELLSTITAAKARSSA